MGVIVWTRKGGLEPVAKPLTEIVTFLLTDIENSASIREKN